MLVGSTVNYNADWFSTVWFRLVQNSVPRSRTPTPRIESTSQELADSPHASGPCGTTVSPAASEGPSVKYNTVGLSDTATANNSDGDSIFTSEVGDLSGSPSGWSEIKHDVTPENSNHLSAGVQSGECCSLTMLLYVVNLLGMSA